MKAVSLERAPEDRLISFDGDESMDVAPLFATAPEFILNVTA
jgi:hypothetical protein